MSDDKNPKDSGKPDGTGSETDPKNPATTVGFGELLGHIDSRIESILSKRGNTNTDSKGGSGTTGEDPQSVREQLRAELAKLQGEEAAAKKDADRDVTIQQLVERMDKISEAAPVEEVGRLTAIMWGKRSKS